LGLTTPDGHLDRVARPVDEDEFAFGDCFLGCFGGYFRGFADVFEDAHDIDGGVFFDVAELGEFDKVEASLGKTDSFVALEYKHLTGEGKRTASMTVSRSNINSYSFWTFENCFLAILTLHFETK